MFSVLQLISKNLFENFRWRAGDTVSSDDQLAIGDEARMDESTLSQAPSFSNLAAMADKPTAQLQVRFVHFLSGNSLIKVIHVF